MVFLLTGQSLGGREEAARPSPGCVGRGPLLVLCHQLPGLGSLFQGDQMEASRERAFWAVTGEAFRAWPKVTVTIPPRDSVWARFTSGRFPGMRGAWSLVPPSSSPGLVPEPGTARVQGRTAPTLPPARSPLFCVSVDSLEVRKIAFGEKGKFSMVLFSQCC